MKFTGQTRKHELTLEADREGRVSAWLRNGAPLIKERGDQRGEMSQDRRRPGRRVRGGGGWDSFQDLRQRTFNKTRMKRGCWV